MYPPGHIGIGVHLLPERLRRGGAWKWIALGCVLPDLLDKPWWLATQLLHGRSQGTRLFGHSLLFCALLAVASRVLRSPAARAVTLGVLTHLVLDVAGELAADVQPIWTGWLFWPLLGWRFPVESEAPPPAFSEVKLYLAADAIGLALLLRDHLRWRRARKRP